MIFLDTSAIFALVDSKDSWHERASGVWGEFKDAKATLLTTNYVVVEAVSIVQNRFGVSAVYDLLERLFPLTKMEWVSSQDHTAGLTLLIATNRRRLSLVDCTSFEVMRRLRITRAFAVDPHFKEQGFEVVP